MLRCARHLLANVLTRVRVTVRDGLVLRVMSVVRSVIGVMHVGRVRGMELRHQGLHDLLLQHLMRTVMVRHVMMCVAMVMSVSVVMRWVVRHVMVSVVVTVMVHVRSWIARSSRGELLLLRISEGRTTRGTEVTVLIHALETRAVHGVTTGQERNGLATVEHPLLGGTARTLGLESNVHLALVRVFDFDRQAHATLVAVPVVNVQTLAHATYAAVVAVVDALALLIVPQLAHLAVVVRYLPPAVLVRAHLTHGLDRVALHAHHLLGRVAAGKVVSSVHDTGTRTRWLLTDQSCARRYRRDTADTGRTCCNSQPRSCNLCAGSSVRSALRIIYLQYYMPHLPLVVLAAKMKFLFVLHPEWNKVSTCCNTEEGTEKLPDRTAKDLDATR